MRTAEAVRSRRASWTVLHVYDSQVHCLAACVTHCIYHLVCLVQIQHADQCQAYVADNPSHAFLPVMYSEKPSPCILSATIDGQVQVLGGGRGALRASGAALSFGAATGCSSMSAAASDTMSGNTAVSANTPRGPQASTSEPLK